MSARRLLFAMTPAARPIAASVHEPRVCTSILANEWGKITVADGLLQLAQVLPAGQSFRWLDFGHIQWHGSLYREWAGVISDAPVVLREPVPPASSPAVVYLRHADEDDDDARAYRMRELADYLRADVDLTATYAEFCARDTAFRAAHERHPGCRVLRQPPTETLFAFICSSNNNIRRIEGMMRSLAAMYGTRIGEHRGHPLYQFPTVEMLAEKSEESELREASFGYRAKFIVGTAKAVAARADRENCTAEQWLMSLRQLSRQQVEDELIQFPGIGRKVAGCIALLSLDVHSAIPVDTHVWKVAQRYMPKMKTKTLTKTVYEEVGDFFRDKFGEDAGLAHNSLFLEELAEFKEPKTKVRSKKRPRRKAKEEALDESAASDDEENVAPEQGKMPKNEDNVVVKEEAVAVSGKLAKEDGNPVVKEEAMTDGGKVAKKERHVKAEVTFATMKRRKPR